MILRRPNNLKYLAKLIIFELLINPTLFFRIGDSTLLRYFFLRFLCGFGWEQLAWATREQRLTIEDGSIILSHHAEQLSEYAAYRPDIYSRSVRILHQDDFRGTIPPCNDMLCELLTLLLHFLWFFMPLFALLEVHHWGLSKICRLWLRRATFEQTATLRLSENPGLSGSLWTFQNGLNHRLFRSFKLNRLL